MLEWEINKIRRLNVITKNFRFEREILLCYTTIQQHSFLMFELYELYDIQLYQCGKSVYQNSFQNPWLNYVCKLCSNLVQIFKFNTNPFLHFILASLAFYYHMLFIMLQMRRRYGMLCYPTHIFGGNQFNEMFP